MGWFIFIWKVRFKDNSKFKTEVTIRFGMGTFRKFLIVIAYQAMFLKVDTVQSDNSIPRFL
jgi:hypothetical protein